MTDGFLYELSKLLECPVCMETFDNPKQLWCGHALCLNCINKLKQPYIGLLCPLCRIPTKIKWNVPPQLYIVQDFVQLYKKAIESRKYVEAIMPLLKNNARQQPTAPQDGGQLDNDAGTPVGCLIDDVTIFPPKNPPPTGHHQQQLANGQPASAVIISTYCLECNLSRDVNDLWLCSDCASSAICSRCILLKQHAGHNVTLYVNIIDRRKSAVEKWRETVTSTLDSVYKNRLDLDYGETRLKFLRLQTEPVESRVSPPVVAAEEDSLLMKFTDDVETSSSQQLNEFVAFQTSTSELKHEFAELRQGLTCLQNESFLLSAEDAFTDELASLESMIRNLHKKQTSLLEKQKALIDKLFPKPVRSPPAQVPDQRPPGYKGAANRHVANNGIRGGGNNNGRYHSNNNNSNMEFNQQGQRRPSMVNNNNGGQQNYGNNGGGQQNYGNNGGGQQSFGQQQTVGHFRPAGSQQFHGVRGSHGNGGGGGYVRRDNFPRPPARYDD